MTIEEVLKIGGDIGHLEGWDVFDVDGRYMVLKDDDAGLLESDLQAEVLAKRAGITIDDNGYVVDANGNTF